MTRMRTYSTWLAAIRYHSLRLTPLILCQRKTIAINFEFTRSSGFTNYSEPRAILQMAFAYTVLDPEEGKPVRRLRICTLKLDASSNVGLVYQSTHSDVIMSLLTQQVVQATFDKGLEEARLLLQDWLINFSACYNKAINGATKDNVKSVSDMLFLKSPAVQFIPRFVYSLLRNPLLAVEGVHPDYRIYLQCVYR